MCYSPFFQVCHRDVGRVEDRFIVPQGIYSVEIADGSPFVRMAVIGKIPEMGVMDGNSEILV